MKKDNKERPGSGRGNRYSNSFHDKVIPILIEKGCSGHQAEDGFRYMFQFIGEHIQCGEVVHLPGLGIIKAVPSDDNKQQKHEGRTGKPSHQIAPLQTRIRIIFMPDQPLDLTPLLSPAEIETQALAAEIACPLWAWFWIVCRRKDGLKCSEHLE